MPADLSHTAGRRGDPLSHATLVNRGHRERRTRRDHDDRELAAGYALAMSTVKVIAWPVGNV